MRGIKRSKIVYKLINYNANRKLLSLVPHKKILDLAMVYYCILGDIEDGNATALIYNSNIKNWHIKEDELYRTAVSNTPKLLPVKIYEMSELIKYVDTEEGRYSLDDPWCSNLYVLTNKSRINGAAGIMYEGVLKKLADKLESDIYILPSSIHEVIILPKSTMFNKEELMAMVRDVNTEGVSKMMKFCHIQCMNMTEIQKNYILKCTQWESNPRPFRSGGERSIQLSYMC